MLLREVDVEVGVLPRCVVAVPQHNPLCLDFEGGKVRVGVESVGAVEVLSDELLAGHRLQASADGALEEGADTVGRARGGVVAAVELPEVESAVVQQELVGETQHRGIAVRQGMVSGVQSFILL